MRSTFFVLAGLMCMAFVVIALLTQASAEECEPAELWIGGLYKLALVYGVFAVAFFAAIIVGAKWLPLGAGLAMLASAAVLAGLIIFMPVVLCTSITVSAVVVTAAFGLILLLALYFPKNPSGR